MILNPIHPLSTFVSATCIPRLVNVGVLIVSGGLKGSEKEGRKEKQTFEHCVLMGIKPAYEH